MRVRVDVTYGQVLAARATELEDDLATVAGYLAQVRAELRHHPGGEEISVLAVPMAAEERRPRVVSEPG